MGKASERLTVAVFQNHHLNGNGNAALRALTFFTFLNEFLVAGATTSPLEDEIRPAVY